MDAELITSAGLIFTVSSLASMYAAKYQLATLGISTGAGWWPPRQWAFFQIWRGIQQVEEGHRGMLLFLAVMMSVAGLFMFGLLPFVVYIWYLTLFSQGWH